MKMKMAIADTILVVGSIASAYLVLTIGSGIMASLLHLSHPLEGSGTIVVSIFLIGPLSIFVVLPATVLSFRWQVALRWRAAAVALNLLGTACAVLSVVWALALFRMGAINPG
jgi:hypothetical protein